MATPAPGHGRLRAWHADREQVADGSGSLALGRAP